VPPESLTRKSRRTHCQAPLIDAPRRLITAKIDIHQDGVVWAN
jgi:hypothetical protein